ncbi:Puff-specific protein Bx42 [Nowakowskiella sp. JEL0407]|nr:Puff-specific protein Bx42 [Nowakowskiella sp. JEL0407]
MSLSSILPRPRNTQSYSSFHQRDQPTQSTTTTLTTKKPAAKVPPYGSRQNYIPRIPEDFGDGGAFPEIFLPQYPLKMGLPQSHGNISKHNVSTQLTNSGTLTLQTDSKGELNYDMIVTQNRSGTVQNKFTDLVPMDVIAKDGEDRWARPSEEEEKAAMEKTLASLSKIVDTKIKAAQPNQVASKSTTLNNARDSQFIRYTPASANASSRIVRMVEAPIDPFEPPKFKFRKVPPAPGSPPAPVLHSPSRKVSAEEQAKWVIPPCISNWKNAKGFTIPLDKRLAADGRGINTVSINDKFASLSEAMYIAEGFAREQVRLRNEMAGRVAEKQKKEKEEELREKARTAREARAGFKPTANANQQSKDDSDSGSDSESEAESRIDEEEAAKIKERNEVRRERERQRVREMRMSHMGSDLKAALAQSNTRDISEKIALGLAKPAPTAESLFDQRLFNQSSGIQSGFGDESSYNLYDKPLWNAGITGGGVYKVKKDDNAIQGVDMDRVGKVLDGKGLGMGQDGAEAKSSGSGGPVMFEKDSDVFGLDQFLSDAKRGKERRDDEHDRKRQRK